ncbi:hypothetical protein [Geobacillus sp. Manikaran-105]|uniref:hypothetical protein n=1 Tax=Geobacillus sp. Manikaran-105 TaxID=2055940 RepID=UPI001E594613|nr:hypothetical protein [Geobacillus sp. Manikaran-105]
MGKTTCLVFAPCLGVSNHALTACQITDRVVTAKQKRKKETDAYSVTLPSFFEEEPKLEIRLKQPVEVTELFGRKKTVRKLYVTVDDIHGFYDNLLENTKRLLHMNKEIGSANPR